MGGGAALHKRRVAGQEPIIRVIDGDGEALPEEVKELAPTG
jgi:hypothetical protein